MEEMKVGDFVREKEHHQICGEVVEMWNVIRIKDEKGACFAAIASTFEKAHKPLSEEDTWLEVALLIGRAVGDWLRLDSGWLLLPEWKAKEIRHQCYQILGSNKIKVTEEVKQKVRKLLERAEQHAISNP